MARFFMAGTNIKDGRAIIRGQDAEHIRVLRMRPGEDVVICDGQGTDYRCRLVSSAPGDAEAEVLEVVPCRGEPAVDVTVYAGLPKGERADFLVQKCVEAGASGIVFFDCERCVAKPDGRSMEKKLERFSRIAEAAAQQSGRGKIPGVSYEHNYVEMLNLAMQAEAKLFMYETGEDRAPLREGDVPRAQKNPAVPHEARYARNGGIFYRRGACAALADFDEATGYLERLIA